MHSNVPFTELVRRAGTIYDGMIGLPRDAAILALTEALMSARFEAQDQVIADLKARFPLDDDEPGKTQ